jgi:collagen beta-1,O-galactosyltransferase
MRMRRSLLCLAAAFAFFVAQSHAEDEDDVEGDNDATDKTVLLVLLLRNKAHTLPYFFAMLDQLDYPKKKIRLHIRSDHNEDGTADLIHIWLSDVADNYAAVDVVINEDIQFYGSDRGPMAWTADRYDHVIALKEEALEAARADGDVDYAWFLDGDAFIINPNTLKSLLSQDLFIAAPLLTTVGPYSNFWAGMSDSYYYLRTPEYMPILERKKDKRGCFDVPMVHSSVLVNVNKMRADRLTFDPAKVKNFKNLPKDDIIAFALSAKSAGIPMHVCNQEVFGHIMEPLDDDSQLEADYARLQNLKLYMIADSGPVPRREDMPRLVLTAQRSSLGVDKIYLINLRRRPDRLAKMEACFEELGIDFELVEAVDGKTIDEDFLEREGVGMLPGYEEPYSKRQTLTYGEIGCFLSHHRIWRDVIDKGYQRVLVFEDDIRFEQDFVKKMDAMYTELVRLRLDWDLVYLGRKILETADEKFLEGSDLLLRPDYTYWTLAYALNKSGAKKMLSVEPLAKMVPVDEFLPIMYDKHPNETWRSHFEPRNLNVLSVQPVYVHPTHYTGEDGYFTDTEWAEPAVLLKEEL